MEKDKPIRKDPYDWRNKVCSSCGVDTTNGRCERHAYICQSCDGFGATTKEAYKALYESETERRNNPPNPCCTECSADFNHTVGSHSDDHDYVRCTCLEGKCDFPNCICHITPSKD